MSFLLNTTSQKIIINCLLISLAINLSWWLIWLASNWLAESKIVKSGWWHLVAVLSSFALYLTGDIYLINSKLPSRFRLIALILVIINLLAWEGWFLVYHYYQTATINKINQLVQKAKANKSKISKIKNQQ
jgi:hypothetical protein